MNNSGIQLIFNWQGNENQNVPTRGSTRKPVMCASPRHKTKTAPELCVWIGGLSEIKGGQENGKKLKEHFEKLGAKPKYVEVGFKDTGGAIFATEEEATAAIAAANGTEFMGKPLEVDVWTKKEKTAK